MMMVMKVMMVIIELAGWAEPGGCETYHHDDFNSNKFQIRAHDDGNDVCLAGKSVSSGR